MSDYRRFYAVRNWAGYIGGVETNWAVYDREDGDEDGDRWPVAAFAKRSHALLWAAQMSDVHESIKRKP